MKLEKLTELVESPLSRRSFAKSISLAAAGVAGATMLSSSVVKAVAQTSGIDVVSPTLTDVDILNFALNLEYLEGEFYTVATQGATLEQEGIISYSDTTGPTIGGNKVPNIANSPIAYIATQITKDEKNHVIFLRTALGSAAVKKPTIKLDALGIGFSSVASFIMLAAAFEDVGTSAYLGAAPLIQNKAYLDAAARIYGTEAQHSGALRTHAIDLGVQVPSVDGKSVPPTPQTPFFVDSKGLTIPRSAQEVLNIVYHGGQHSGGFFPNGLNGNIR